MFSIWLNMILKSKENILCFSKHFSLRLKKSHLNQKHKKCSSVFILSAGSFTVIDLKSEGHIKLL